MGLGWQRVVATDLDKASQAEPTADQIDANGCTVNLDDVFVEDPVGGTANSVKRTTLEVSAKYPLLDRYFVAADYATRRLDLGSGALFRECANFSGTTCTEPTGDRSSKLAQVAFTVGGGMTLSPGLVLTVEYFRETLDHTYAEAYYSSETGSPSNSLEVFNARIAYNWR